ncbi:tRNA (adenosine(37)-N6)-dimethylallyltransferase MiaA [Pedobacter rhodius]|uniref:tRNA dimethylallyltransferase n=1 Tax=Pedobacter rhodius TaxID=3004098 RepID=A0ABT4KUP7_9SPHI|nr:tRNA (adenosine(37)-N6)-dimethylallyltransferase MiaA [Pedobacter sp. SJ11]MCZ4222664.1 tRNA (adenosine(37)-N6)-dimethylallyltransferase MiaA [Pedobacter sp. SJ11]
MSDKPLLIILGATASGKTKLAVQVADALNAEIISADSRQVFRKMDIGTGKDLAEYNINGKTIPHHLINILEPGERYHVDAFKNDFYNAYQSITDKDKFSILCGGTGMYIHSLLQNQRYTAVPVHSGLRTALDSLTKEELINRLKDYPEELSRHVDFNAKKRLIRAIEIAEYLSCNELADVDRPKINSLVFGLKNKVEQTRYNILSRLEYRLGDGMIEEVEDLLNKGVSKEILTFYGLEYKFIVAYLSGDLNYDELKLKLGIAICQYAKRQNTFFRKMEKDGVIINWLDASEPLDSLKQQILEKVF